MEIDLEGVVGIHLGFPVHLHVVQGGFVRGAKGEHRSAHILVQGEVYRYKKYPEVALNGHYCQMRISKHLDP